MRGGYVLYGGSGTGAVAVEAALVLIGAPYALIDVADAQALARTLPAMRQVPAMILPGGETMTESAAILIRLAELHPDARLAPGPDDPRRSQFLRWMSFVASAIHAHYWLMDEPSRLVPGAQAAAAVETGLSARIAACWAVMGAAVTPGRYILGDELNVLDLYVTVISRFRPRRQALYAAAPRIGEAVRRVDADPRLADLWRRRFPFLAGWDG
ncbi:MAG TPA: glutathione S-transferase family protein [Phenylobacterium sp.]|jgi:GST-like protein|nr:glutathione S-transferase family protein [Phenylobacterium sp.]